MTEAAVKQHLLRLYQKFRIQEGMNRRTRLANEVVALGLVRPLPPPGRAEPRLRAIRAAQHQPRASSRRRRRGRRAPIPAGPGPRSQRAAPRRPPPRRGIPARHRLPDRQAS